MGFPNVDIFLTRRIGQTIRDLQTDGRHKVAGLFFGMDEDQLQEVRQYLNALFPTGNVRERGQGRHLYILPHFPIQDIPFPQIGVSVGAEETAEKYLGDEVGEESVPIEEDGKVVAWEKTYGYLASGSWNIDVVCATKDEAIWLSRMVQLAVVESLEELENMGVMEVTAGIQDVRIDPNQFPCTVFVRTVRVAAGKIAHTWTRRIPAYTYDTGVNTAL